MKKFLLSLLATALLATASFATPSPAFTAARKTTHKIVMSAAFEGEVSSCSATAIGPHALITATHCMNQPSVTIEVDGQETDIIQTIGDGLDHTIVYVDATYTDYAKMATEAPAQGDSIFDIGNPGGFTSMYRTGTVSGYYKEEDPKTPVQILLAPRKTKNDAVRLTFYDFNGFFGDSGSAVFNDKGEIAGIISRIIGGDLSAGFSIKFMGSYELRFTADQIEAARTFIPAKLADPVKEEPYKSLLDLLRETKGYGK